MGGDNPQLIGDIGSLVNIQNTLFVNTGVELYRLKDDNWKRLEFPVPGVPVTWVSAVAETEDRLYVNVHRHNNAFNPNPPANNLRKVDQELARNWYIFRSTDLGDSWKDITPIDAWSQNGHPPYIRLIASGETLLAMERGMVRSTDSGDTWMPPQPPYTSPPTRLTSLPDVALNEHIFYVSSEYGLHRSADGGESWNMVHFTQARRRLRLHNLIVYKGNDKGQNMLPVL